VFSLRLLFFLIAFAALACAALLNPSPLWGSAMITVTVAVAVGATIAAWRSSRLFYAPLAGVIWLYLLILFFEPFQELEKNLFSSKLIFVVWSKLNNIEGLSPPDAFIWANDFYRIVRPDGSPGIQTTWGKLLALTGFYYTLHSCAAVLLGTLAGILTAWAYSARPKPNPSKL
jgi:hypothetical protein